MANSKLEKLRKKLQDTLEKREKLTESIKEIEMQIKEEESLAFRSTIEKLDLTYEEAIEFLKNHKIEEKLESSLSDEPTTAFEKEENEHGAI